MMIKRFLIFFILLTTGFAYADDFTTKAKSALLIDYDSGMEIVSKNADVLMPPSSMLKLMTLTVLFDAIKSGDISMDDKLTVPESANYLNPTWYPASKMCLVTGQQISVRDAILGTIVLSAGDATVTIAEKMAGGEEKFTELMQQKAREIGMMKSTFGNASGLPNDNNLMTSRELGMLAKYIIDEHPDLYPMFATKRFEFAEPKSDWCRNWVQNHTVNYNRLLFSMRGADGLKTGHTDGGGYGVVASSKINGRRLIGIINGFKTSGHEHLADEMKKMLEYGYANTQTKIFFKPGDKIADIPVWYGATPNVVATVAENVAITISKKESLNNVRVLARYDSPVAAPISAGQKIGEIVIENNGDVVKRIPLIAKNKVRKIQFFGRIIKNISVMIRGK